MMQAVGLGYIWLITIKTILLLQTVLNKAILWAAIIRIALAYAVSLT